LRKIKELDVQEILTYMMNLSCRAAVKKRLIPVSMTLREFGIALKEHIEQIYTRFCKTMTYILDCAPG